MTATGTAVRRATYRDFEAVDRLMQGFMALHHGWSPEQFRTALLGFTAAIFQGWLERQDEATKARATLLVKARLLEKHGYSGEPEHAPKIFVRHAVGEVVKQLRAERETESATATAD